MLIILMKLNNQDYFLEKKKMNINQLIMNMKQKQIKIYIVLEIIYNGYQLENPIDNQRVGNNIPFEQMVEEQMKNQNNKNMSNINKNINNNNNNNMNLNNQNYNNIGTGGIGAKPRIIDVDIRKVGNTKDFRH